MRRLLAFNATIAVRHHIRHVYASNYQQQVCTTCMNYPGARRTLKLSSTASSAPPTATHEDDERWMRIAVSEARAAAERGEVPVGAVVVRDGIELGRASNRVEQLRDVTQHAEMGAIRAASAASGGWRLIGCTLYSTLEPCAMCLSAAALARVKRVVYGANDLRLGACGTWCDLHTKQHPYHMFQNITSGVLREESEALLRNFFRMRRKQNKALLCTADKPTACDKECE